MKAGSVTAANAMWCLPDVSQDAREETALSTARELDRFLQSVERPAFRIARCAVRDTEEALDIVQDAMMQLVRRYAGKADQLPTAKRYLETNPGLNACRVAVRRRQVVKQRTYRRVDRDLQNWVRSHAVARWRMQMRRRGGSQSRPQKSFPQFLWITL